jgi:flagellar assembly protein FliH
MSDPVIARISLVDARAPTRQFSPLQRRATDTPAAVQTDAEVDRYAIGFDDGQRTAAMAFEAERAGLVRLLAAADSLQPEPSEELAAMIALTVDRLVRAIVGTAPVDRAWLAERIDGALACIGEADAARTLWLHPDDLALVGNLDIALDMLSDPALERGALRIDCSRGWIEDARSVHLDALSATLGTGTSL